MRKLETCAVVSSVNNVELLSCAEMVAVKEVYDGCIQGTHRPLIIFNGELDRIRSGYYPSVFYPGLARMARDWLPQFCTAYYIHNFKGRTPGQSPSKPQYVQSSANFASQPRKHSRMLANCLLKSLERMTALDLVSPILHGLQQQ